MLALKLSAEKCCGAAFDVRKTRVKHTMAVSKIVSVKCVIKGHHVYRITYSCGTNLDCFFEPDNQHSDSAIIVKKGDNTVGHIPEGLCQSLTQLRKEGSIVHITSEITPLKLLRCRRDFCSRRRTGNSLYLRFNLDHKRKRFLRSAIKQQIWKLSA